MDEHDPEHGHEHDPFDDGDLAGAPPTPEALRAIVARHRRSRTRALGVGLAVAVIAGPVAGWALARSSEGGSQQVATGAPAPAAPEAKAAPGGAPTGSGATAYNGVPPGVTGHHLFTRTTADGITIRAYRSDPPTPPTPTPETATSVPPNKDGAIACAAGSGAPEAGSAVGGRASGSANSGSAASANTSSGAPPPNSTPVEPPVATPPCPAPVPCTPTPSLLTELSNDAAVGQGFAPLSTDAPADLLTRLSSGQFGVMEGNSAFWVAVRTGAGVTTVRLRLPSGASDQMAPVDGLAVLAGDSPAPPPAGTVVEALDTSGKVVGSFDVDNQQSVGTVFSCAVATSGSTARVTAKPAPAPAPLPPTTR